MSCTIMPLVDHAGLPFSKLPSVTVTASHDGSVVTMKSSTLTTLSPDGQSDGSTSAATERPKANPRVHCGKQTTAFSCAPVPTTVQLVRPVPSVTMVLLLRVPLIENAR